MNHMGEHAVQQMALETARGLLQPLVQSADRAGGAAGQLAGFTSTKDATSLEPLAKGRQQK